MAAEVCLPVANLITLTEGYQWRIEWLIINIVLSCPRSSGEGWKASLPTEGGVGGEATNGLQALLQQRNFIRNINPRDPLNVNIRKAFLEYDKDL